MKLFLLFLIFSSCYSNDLIPSFEKIIFNNKDKEISGLLVDAGKILYVADDTDDTYVFSLSEKKDKKYKTKKFIKLHKLKGYKEYIKSTNSKFKSWDLEGLAKCDDTIYMINERQRDILILKDNEIKSINVNLSPYFKKYELDPTKLQANAGFEGIALDCEKSIAYIIQERSPRSIIVYDLKNKLIQDFIDILPSKDNANPDFSGAHFETPYLYVLERNTRKIIKVDVKNKKEIATMSYSDLGGFALKDLYKNDAPYGMAEGLYFDQDYIYIGIDNNEKDLTKHAIKVFGDHDDHSSILVFKRAGQF